jgi:hypothetical protein
MKRRLATLLTTVIFVSSPVPVASGQGAVETLFGPAPGFDLEPAAKEFQRSRSMKAREPERYPEKPSEKPRRAGR